MRRIALVFLVLLLFIGGCRAGSSTTSTTTRPVTPTPTSTLSPAALSAPALKYRLIDSYGPVFFCDPDYYPVARTGQEEQNAIDQFPAIRANEAEFKAIISRLGMQDKSNYTSDEKMSIYREHKKLAFGVEMVSTGATYSFTLRIGENQGYRIGGSITVLGAISETSREASFNTCPICLSKGTLIATPSGDVPVEQITAGMSVWTADSSGGPVEASVIVVSNTPVPPGFQIVHLILGDGRSVMASPGHPSAQGRVLGEYIVGEPLDGAIIISAGLVPYDEGTTYDLLPAGPTGTYWAGGILLKSTLAR